MKAVLFDNDGVLVDTEEMFFEATRAAFETAGTELARSLWARHYLGEGQHSRDIARRLGIDPSSVEEVIARRDRLFWEKADRGVPILPGVTQTLDRLAGRFRLAIVTRAPRYHADRVHASTGLLTFFETMVTQDDYANPQAELRRLPHGPRAPAAAAGGLRRGRGLAARRRGGAGGRSPLLRGAHRAHRSLALPRRVRVPAQPGRPPGGAAGVMSYPRGSA